MLTCVLGHFLYVFYDAFTNQASIEEWNAAVFRNKPENHICGDRRVEIEARITILCDSTRSLLYAWGPLNWGYWNYALKATWEEHLQHVRNLVMVPLYVLFAAFFHWIIANPWYFFTTLATWVTVLQQLLVSLGMHSLQRARKLQLEDRLARRESLAAACVLPAAENTRPFPAGAVLFTLDGSSETRKTVDLGTLLRHRTPRLSE